MIRRDERRRAVLALGLVVSLLAGCASVPDEAVQPVALARPQPPGSDTATLAERALAEGRIDDAGMLLRRAMLDGGDAARARLVAAELHLASGAPRAAAAAFHELTGVADVAARALQGEGIALTLSGGDAAAGYASLRAAVARDPTLWRAWNALGYQDDLRGDWRQATDHYDRALALNPASAMVLNNRGFSKLLQGRADAAVADLSRALQLDPDLAPARENLRLALAWEGSYASALAGAEPGGLARALNNVGFMALLRGDHASAEAYFVRAIEVDPAFNEAASRNLAYLQQMRAKYPGAAPSLRR